MEVVALVGVGAQVVEGRAAAKQVGDQFPFAMAQGKAVARAPIEGVVGGCAIA
jgi:hypothetical protein